MYSIRKLVRVPGTMCKDRMHVKAFKFSDDMHKFLNSQDNNNWQIMPEPMKTGIYAFAGGKWHNVKTLDASILAHI